MTLVSENNISSDMEFILTRRSYIYVQGVPGGMCQTSGECSLG